MIAMRKEQEQPHVPDVMTYHGEVAESRELERVRAFSE
jgi:hypothetical protein